MNLGISQKYSLTEMLKFELDSYFHGLLSGSFSESETFLNLLMYLYGYTIDITSSGFLPLLEAALYFGVERLLSNCKSWLSVLALSNDPALPQLEFSDLIQIWSFGLEHVGEFVTDLCVAYLAKNFMLIKSDVCFGDVPYELLMCCVKHPHMTVHSERHLADAILVWLDADKRLLESSQDNTINLIQQVSRMALAHVISKNTDLKSLKARGCKNLSGQELFKCLGKGSALKDLDIGWRFSYFSLESLRPAVSFLRAISVGLGASLGEDGLKLLSSASPLLESVVLYFLEITDSALTSIMTSLKHLQELALSYCFGDISRKSSKFSMPNLRKLRLERVTPWMTNDDLLVITQSYPNLTELSLVGCSHLNSDAQTIISTGWPGMISLHLEECGRITENGVASLYSCIALEDLLLRHNGSGIQKRFLLDAALKFPMLRLVSLDTCDAKEGDFDVPEEKEEDQ